MIVIVMGVSGCGKTYVGSKLAKHLGGPFAEGDEFHSPENVAKMRGGTPLTDEDRWPWLHAIAARIDAWREEGQTAVVACSALRKVYRDILMGDREDVVAVHLKGSYKLISDRLAERQHEYMPTSLLKSQFDTLEEPDKTENVITVSIDQTPDEVVAEAIAGLKAKGLMA
ncbi:MAG: gluconokinase [Rhodospirillales bacterium]|nr:gluconokinase [Rhodospirillales bacterium]